MLTRAWVSGVLLLLGAQACAGGSDARPLNINRADQVPVKLTIQIEGDVNVSVTQTVRSHFIVKRTDSDDTELRRAQVVGTEPVEPIRVGGAALIAGIAVMPFEGDGEYTIPIGSPFDLANAAQRGATDIRVGSSIKIDWWPTGDLEAASETYMRRAQPCKVIVENSGLKGLATCPDVTNEAQDRHFALTLRWEAPPA